MKAAKERKKERESIQFTRLAQPIHTMQLCNLTELDIDVECRHWRSIFIISKVRRTVTMMTAFYRNLSIYTYILRDFVVSFDVKCKRFSFVAYSRDLENANRYCNGNRCSIAFNFVVYLSLSAVLCPCLARSCQINRNFTLIYHFIYVHASL